MFKKLISVLLPIPLILNIQPASSTTSPERKLIADAIKLYNSVTPEDSTKVRLTKRENFLKTIDQIIDQYSDTDIGLELLTNNSYKNLNITKIRENYLGELTKYNLDVCEVDPNFNCLGFVSLAQANKACKNSNQSLSQLLLASKNLNNAYDIFSNEPSSKKYIPSVFSSFRQCVDKTNEQFSKDFIKSNFVKVLLKNQDTSKAMGITERMETDLFKVHSAADIRDSQGKFDNATFLTLLKKSKRLNNQNQEISALYLTNKLLKNDLNPFDDSLFKYYPPEFRSTGIECGDKHDYYSNLGINYIFLSKKIKAKGRQKDNKDFILNDLDFAINKCNSYNTTPIKYFLNKGYDDIASRIFEFQTNNGLNPKDGTVFFERVLSKYQISDYYLNQAETFENLILDRNRNRNSGSNTNALLNDLGKAERKIMYPYIGLDGDFAIYRAFVDTNNICNASSHLFKTLIDTKYEPEAVAYFISSPGIINQKNYSCGDAELELLIR